MTKERQDHVWKHCLPKEFKEEVKRMYRIADSNVDQMIATIMLENVFGLHNLTSDTEGEADEVLTVSRKQVQKMYAFNEDILFLDPTHSGAKLLRAKLYALFGSKCLPDEEVKPAEPELRSDGTAHFDNIITDGFHDHNRLHIAAMALQGILSNYQMLQNLTEGETTTEGVLNCVATAALRYTDTLIEAASKNKDK